MLFRQVKTVCLNEKSEVDRLSGGWMYYRSFLMGNA